MKNYPFQRTFFATFLLWWKTIFLIVKHKNGLTLVHKSNLWLYSDQARYSVFWPGQIFCILTWSDCILTRSNKHYLSSPLITLYIIIALIVDKLIVLVEEEDFKDDFQISYTSNWVDGCTIFLQRKDHPFPGWVDGYTIFWQKENRSFPGLSQISKL